MVVAAGVAGMGEVVAGIEVALAIVGADVVSAVADETATGAVVAVEQCTRLSGLSQSAANRRTGSVIVADTRTACVGGVG